MLATDESQISSWAELLQGVRQGSVVGPLLHLN